MTPSREPTGTNTWDELRQAVEEVHPSSSDSECSEDGSEELEEGDVSFQSMLSGVSDALSSISLGEKSSLSGSEVDGDSCSSQAESESGTESESEINVENDTPSEPQSPRGVEPAQPSSLPLQTTTPFGSQGAIPVDVAGLSAETPPPDEELALRHHVRTVSLAMANGFDFNRDEISPTLTHILLRAPRRFKHPAWLPKQNLSRALDDRVTAFFARTSAPEATAGTTRRGPVEDGIRIECTPKPQAAIRQLEVKVEAVAGKNDLQEMNSGDDDEGANDMIWWQWNAESIRGFADI
ncbi:hypothetical protein FRB97_003391 [Tulasnella sp. 331]|nr:hypothetical protein FRB97_003391 [Tulasnella sp. 331]